MTAAEMTAETVDIFTITGQRLVHDLTTQQAGFDTSDRYRMTFQVQELFGEVTLTVRLTDLRSHLHDARLWVLAEGEDPAEFREKIRAWMFARL